MANYIYSSSTANNNPRNHLYKLHGTEYDQVVGENGWAYKLSTSKSNDTASLNNARNVRDRALPQFSPAAFLEHLVCFIVADDQASPNNLVFIHALTCF